MENNEILWDEVGELLFKAAEIVGIDLYNSTNVMFSLSQKSGITASWRSFVDHPKYGGTEAYFERYSKE